MPAQGSESRLDEESLGHLVAGEGYPCHKIHLWNALETGDA